MSQQGYSAGQVSPDGRWRWDGLQWLPNQGGPPPKPRGARSAWTVVALILLPPLGLILVWFTSWTTQAKRAATVGGVVWFVVWAAIGFGNQRPSDQPGTAATAASPSAEVPAAVTEIPSSPQPARSATPTQSPVQLSGQGSKVTDPFHLAAGTYKIAWKADGGPDNFIVGAHRGRSSSQAWSTRSRPTPARGRRRSVSTPGTTSWT